MANHRPQGVIELNLYEGKVLCVCVFLDGPMAEIGHQLTTFDDWPPPAEMPKYYLGGRYVRKAWSGLPPWEADSLTVVRAAVYEWEDGEQNGGA